MLAITLRVARECAGLTQQQVEAALGMHTGVCDDIERAQRMPTVEMLRGLCPILRLDFAAVAAIVDRGGTTLPC
ncbi:helix-turn-helix domain-containing protein [Archangium gephyra]|uniref:helix-turn-helix domain-containing protein n=1 Tax=Archangium gephyra TaxID=48 RepID=UPI003B763249